jgi:hypothetical protein
MADRAGLPLVGDDVLESVNEAMDALHERYHGRAPATSRTTLEVELFVFET